MRGLLVVLVVLLVLVIAGWVSFQVSGNRASMNLETQKIEQDTEKAVEGTKDLLRKADDKIDEEVNEHTVDDADRVTIDDDNPINDNTINDNTVVAP